VQPEDVLAYVAAIAAHPGYTERFREDLEVPGARIPLTADPQLWTRALEVGRRILWLHAYGERYVDAEAGRPARIPRLPAGDRPRCFEEIPDTPEDMPDGKRIRLGKLLIWGFSGSGWRRWSATRVFADEELAALRRFPEIGGEELLRFFALAPVDVRFVRLASCIRQGSLGM
jgi:hypothetical protein